MNKGQSNVEHNMRVLDGVINEVAKRFHRFRKSHHENREDDEHLAMIAGRLGYLVNISIGATKTWNFDERIKALEDEKNNPVPKEVRKEYQFNPDIMLTVIRDSNGRLMN